LCWRLVVLALTVHCSPTARLHTPLQDPFRRRIIHPSIISAALSSELFKRLQPRQPTNLDQHLSASPSHVHCLEPHGLAATHPQGQDLLLVTCTLAPFNPSIQPTDRSLSAHFCTRPAFYLQRLARGRKIRNHLHICSPVPTKTTAICAGAHHPACAPSIAHPGSPRQPVCVLAV
jgi:hypothetical protein